MTTNAALIQQRLHNQRLVRPGFDQPAEVVAWLGALQGQDYPGAKWSLGLRLVNGTDVQVEQAIADGHVVRTWAMRGTLHLVAAADVRWLVALVAPGVIAGNARRYRELELDEHTLARSSEVIASQLRQPLARKALLAILEQNGISTKGQRAPYLLQRASLDGLIGQGVMQGRESVFFPLPDAKSRAPEDGAAELARRYFASRGPATLKDFIWWSGLAAADARAGLEAVKSALAEMKIEGQSYWHIDAGAVATESSVYLLPGFDEYLLGYKDRGAVLDPQHAKKVLPGGGIFAPTIISAGRVVGTWKRTVRKNSVVVTPAAFGTLTTAERDALAAAAQVYGGFLGLPATVEF